MLDLCVQETGDVAIEDESVRRQHLGGGRVLQRGNNSGEGSDRAVGGEAQDQDGEDGVLEEGQAAGGVRTLPLAAPEEAVGMKKKKKKKKRGRRQNNHDDEWEREIKADSVLARAANDDKATGTGCSDATGAGASAGASASASVSAGAGAGSGASAGAGGIAGFRCTSCAGSSFADKTEHREHFRSEWHRVNLKLKLKKLPPLTQAEYEDMAGDDVSMFLKQLT